MSTLFTHIMHIYTLHKKVKDICQYLYLKTKIKANSQNSIKHLGNFKISLTFLCSVYVLRTKHVPYLLSLLTSTSCLLLFKFYPVCTGLCGCVGLS